MQCRAAVLAMCLHLGLIGFAACSDAEGDAKSATAAPRHVVLNLSAAPTDAMRASLSAAGFRVISPLANRALLLERTHEPDVTLAPGALLRPWTAAERISRELTAESLTAVTVEHVPVLLHVMPGDGGAALRDWLIERGLPVQGTGAAGTFLRVGTMLPRADAAALADELGERPDVYFIERVHKLGFFNGRSAGSVQSGRQGSERTMTPIWAKGLRGEGQVVGLIDSGVDVDACQFRDARPPQVNTFSNGAYEVAIDATHRKLIAYDFLYSCAQFPDASDCEDPERSSAWDNHGHGTHCAGSIAGEHSGPNDGMAPAAKIVVQDGGSGSNSCSEMPGLGCPVIDLYPVFDQAYRQGVRIHNNSYGDNEEAPVPQQSNYSARSQDVDRFVWDHKDMLIVFAAGNSGDNNVNFSVTSPSTNKNGLSVGSVRTSATSTNDENVSSFSSRGWTSDGRIKPDLLAPGCTVSAGSDSNIDTNNCTQDTGCGTSYAAPIIAGAAALVRQYFTEGFYPSGAKNAADALAPSAALLKASLLNGAVSLEGVDNNGGAITPIPSNEQGWGRVQLARSLVFNGGALKLFVDDRSTGFASGSTETVRYTFSGVTENEPFKVTLVWTDFPGAVDAPPRAPVVSDPTTYNPPLLVNDLNLVVRAGAETFLGNVFEGGRSRAGGAPDQRNNVEQVLIEAPAAPEVTVEVTAANVLQAGQDYALVATGEWLTATRVSDPPPAGLAGAPAPAAMAGSPAGTGGTGGGLSAGGTKSDSGAGGAAGTPRSVSFGSSGGPGPFAVPRPERDTPPAAEEDESSSALGCGCRAAGATPRNRGGVLSWFGAFGAFGLLVLRSGRRHRRR